jgi:hypothetical protein
MQVKVGDSVLVAGNAVRDAEYKLVGEKNSPMCLFSLAVGKREDTTTIFVNCKAWRNNADYAAGIRKGDSVMAIGKIEEREYNDKTYKTLVADWLNYIGESAVTAVVISKAESAGFAELPDDDGELPF